VVATRCGGPEEIIHESNGILIPVDDEDALLKALEKMCTAHPDYRPESLMADAETRFGMESAAKSFDRWYRSCLG
jgi:glycosyltransferase involved in cell wall biosynthesis